MFLQWGSEALEIGFLLPIYLAFDGEYPQGEGFSIFLHFSDKNGNEQREKLDNWFPIFLWFPLCYTTKLLPYLLLLSRYVALKEQYAIVLVIFASFFWVLLQFLLQK